MAALARCLLPLALRTNVFAEQIEYLTIDWVKGELTVANGVEGVEPINLITLTYLGRESELLSK